MLSSIATYCLYIIKLIQILLFNYKNVVDNDP